jgi:hypothetical protein
MNTRLGKYEFNSKEQADSKIEGLGVNEEGFPTHNHTIVRLGNITLSKATYDEDGNELTPAVHSDKYHIDVLWHDIDSHPYGWATYAIDLDNEGSHGFFGVSYIGNKM